MVTRKTTPVWTSPISRTQQPRTASGRQWTAHQWTGEAWEPHAEPASPRENPAVPGAGTEGLRAAESQESIWMQLF